MAATAARTRSKAMLISAIRSELIPEIEPSFSSCAIPRKAGPSLVVMREQIEPDSKLYPHSDNPESLMIDVTCS